MTKDEAIALFTRVHTALSETVQHCMIWLIYEQQAHLTGTRTWHVTVESGGRHYKMMEAQDWECYKRMHAIHETEQDLDAYADAMRAQAEADEA